MKAIVYSEYGGPEQLRLEDIEKPVPKENEVLLKVCAVSINDWDWGLLTGAPWINRFMFGLRSPNGKRILGCDVAGVVESVGLKVTKLKVGDEVFGDISSTWGGMAEFVCAPETRLMIKHASITFIDAAAVPQAGILAVQGLIDRGKIQVGQKVLINGGGGGVGTIGLQIAKQFNTEITGVDHTRKLEQMQRSGFDHVIDYTKEDFTKSNQKYDLIFDVKTNRSLFSYLRVLSSKGVYVTCGGTLGRLLQALLVAPLVFLFTGKHIRIVAMKPNKDLGYLSELMQLGKMKPLIDSVYKLDDSRKAFEKYGNQEHIGKIIITV